MMMSTHLLCHDLSHSGKFWHFPLRFADAVEFMSQYYQNSCVSRSVWECNSSPQIVFRGGSLSKAGGHA